MDYLTNEQLVSRAPSIGATKPQFDVSELYTFIPTLSVVDMLAEEGWLPVSAEEVPCRVDGNRGFQKHLIKFENPYVKIGDQESIQAVLVNSHNRSCAYNFFTGVFRFICSNGMIVGDTFEKIQVKHVNHDPMEIIDASYEILENAPVVGESINEMKELTLCKDEQEAFAKSALTLITDKPEEAPFAAERLLWARRGEDRRPSVWNTFNVVQENIMKGGISGISKNRKSRIKTKAVKSIDRNLKLNKALWTLVEEMKKLKA